jgi:hypothetical protein
MKQPRTWMSRLLPVLFMAACIPYDVEEDFCANAGTAQQEAICDRTSESPSSSDGVVNSSCGASTQCTMPPSQCHEPLGTCVAGTCTYPLKQTGASCEDGQLCTVNDTCDDAGKCTGGSPFVCDAPPTKCHEAAGTCANNTCIYKLKTSGASCSDGNPCTESDQCNSAGICAGKAKACNSPPGQCYQSSGTCNASSGACAYGPKSAGTACETGNRCTEDTCDGRGTCLGGEATDCSADSELCMISDGCNPQTGCEYRNKCASQEICQNGICCPNYAISGVSSSMILPDCQIQQEPL